MLSKLLATSARLVDKGTAVAARQVPVRTAPRGERRRPDSATWGVLDEFLTTALLTAATTSVLLALSKGRTIRISGPTEAHLPKLPVLFETTERAKLATSLGPAIVRHLDVIYGKLTRLLAELPGDHSVRTSAHQNVDWTALSIGWSDLCAEVRMVLLVLCDSEVLIGYQEWGRAMEIEGLVKAARYGGLPCIRSDGAVIVPAWLDTRREPRVPIGATVSIETAQSQHRVVLKDMSLSGMGLSSAPSLAAKSNVVIMLPSGERLDGIVVWSFGGNLGVRLATTLSGSDPIVSSLRVLRSKYSAARA